MLVQTNLSEQTAADTTDEGMLKQEDDIQTDIDPFDEDAPADESLDEDLFKDTDGDCDGKSETSFANEGNERADKAEKFTVRYNGKDVELTLDELKTNAQKGLNYDHIKSERDALKGLNAQGEPGINASNSAANLNEAKGLADSKEVAQDDAQGDTALGMLEDFMREYPEIDPSTIPSEVWDGMGNGQELLSAFRAYENQQLKAQIKMYEQNQSNKLRAVGSVLSESQAAAPDAFLSGLLG